jgi:uncharacterized membrane protein
MQEKRRAATVFWSGFALVALLVLLRYTISGKLYYGFLLWNLLLAYIPYRISHWLSVSFGLNGAFEKAWQASVVWLIGFAAWLLFFPNAPYIVTDFVHLAARHGIPIWYDAALLFAAASTSLWTGCLSLLQMEKLWRQKVRIIPAPMFVAAVLLLCGFGIYLGRFLRFNSWDVLTHPVELLWAVGVRILMPWQHGRTWGTTVVFALLLWVDYQQVKRMTQVQSD